MDRLTAIINQINPLQSKLLKEGRDYCDRLAKPLGALGKMEEIYARLYAIFRGDIRLEKKVMMVYVSDNGIVDEGVSSNPQETTYIVAKNMLDGQAAIAILAKQCQAELCVVDSGCKRDIYPTSDDKISQGTKNMLLEAAMTREQAIQAILLGYDKTCEWIEQGYTLFGTGEMGIGNTTTSAALISAILEIPPSEVTGYGAGLTESMKDHKTEVIETCLKKHAPFEDSLDIVSKIGGYDILGMVGTHLACAQYQLPCVVDGLISATGLLVASQFSRLVLDYAFASHISTEPGYRLVQERLGLNPLLSMDMRLGEGVGCPFIFDIMETSVTTIEAMPQFKDSLLNKEDYVDIRLNEST